MQTVLNVLWLILAGLWLAIGYVVAGIIACVLIVTIPFGVAAFRLAGYAIWPFGRTVVPKEDAGVGSAVGNVLWFLVAGWWLALGHLLTAVILFVTIIGIPLAVANLKMIPLALVPFGKQVVPAEAVAP